MEIPGQGALSYERGTPVPGTCGSCRCCWTMALMPIDTIPVVNPIDRTYGPAGRSLLNSPRVVTQQILDPFSPFPLLLDATLREKSREWGRLKAKVEPALTFGSSGTALYQVHADHAGAAGQSLMSIHTIPASKPEWVQTLFYGLTDFGLILC